MSYHRSRARRAYNPSTREITVPFSNTEIKTMVTNQAVSVQSWVESIRSTHDGIPTIVGLDCEWKPSYDPWEYENKVATLQLCIDKKCIVIQLFHIDNIPDAFRNFLQDTNYKFVGIEVADDIAKLTSGYGLGCGNSADMGPLCSSYVGSRALKYRKSTLGLKDYAWEVLEVRMDKFKFISRSNWQVKDLSEEQIHYACIDAYVSYQLGSKLIQES